MTSQGKKMEKTLFSIIASTPKSEVHCSCNANVEENSVNLLCFVFVIMIVRQILIIIVLLLISLGKIKEFFFKN